jgi:hypothetical protein
MYLAIMSKQAEELLSRFVLVLLRLRLHCFQEAFSTPQPYEEARDRPAETIVQKNQGAGQSTLNSQASRFVNDTKGKERARGNSRNRSRTAAKHNARVQMTSGERICRGACFLVRASSVLPVLTLGSACGPCLCGVVCTAEMSYILLT